jgi:hypothetical protein
VHYYQIVLDLAHNRCSKIWLNKQSFQLYQAISSTTSLSVSYHSSSILHSYNHPSISVSNLYLPSCFTVRSERGSISVVTDPRPGSVHFGTDNIMGWITLHCGGCSVHYRAFSVITGQNVSTHCQIFPERKIFPDAKPPSLTDFSLKSQKATW